MKDLYGLINWNRAYSCSALVDLFNTGHDFSPVGHSWAAIYFIICMMCVVLLKLKAFPDHFLD